MKSAKFLPYVWYPVSFAVAIIVFGALLSHGSPIPIALYVPIVLIGLLIVALEQWFPYRLDWRPSFADIKSDAAFLAIVQIFFPKVLGVIAVLAISEWTHAKMPSDWWPQAWPPAAQVILMVLVIDFMRYWVHRACHRFMWLWRLHEVHHSPDILYSLNVGRFHPLEKILHFFFDTIPFLLLGVAPQVLAGYALLYSVNGFFQHSNICLRYGWLNYLVGSAETHRWHHAKDPKAASCNFGNTTIVWDLFFGTWYLPKDKTLDQIGIMNAAYPKDFLSQMVTPFRSFPYTQLSESFAVLS
ncbi:MAG: sterol desaturase family protein [Pseudomonadota bacterium]